jgi:nucleoside-diphosphate-sugar epimerase
MTERVLVTGASGFVGLPLVAALVAEGMKVEAVGYRNAGAELPGVRWHRVDLHHSGDVRLLLRELRPAVLVHCAWYVEHGRFWSAPDNRVWLDVSFELAMRFFETGGRRFVGIGTCAEYASRDLNDNMPWPESRKIDPATLYGQAKAELWRRLVALAERRPGVQAAWARLFHLFGAGEHPERLVPSIIRSVLAGREACCGSGHLVRDFSSVWFAAGALAALACSRVTGPVNVASGHPCSIAALSRQVARLAGRPDLLRLGALPDRPGDVPVMVADTKRLRLEVGYDQRPVIEDDLRRLISLYRLQNS